MAAIPSHCNALVTHVEGDKPLLKKQHVPVPELGDHEILVKVQYIAQNPSDVKILGGNIMGPGVVLGSDFVGTVVKTGPSADRFAKGDTVSAFKLAGAYSEYAVANERICFAVPKGMDPAAASTVPLAGCTAFLALFASTALAIKREGHKAAQAAPVLIWGAATSVGMYAVQIAATAGLEVIATSSPKHFDTIKSLGVKHVFDYRDAQVVSKIRAAAPDLQYAFETVGEETTLVPASECLRDQGGKVCTVKMGLDAEARAKRAELTSVLVFTVFNQEFPHPAGVLPASQENHDLGVELMQRASAALEAGKFKTNPVKLYEGGLDDVSKGFQEYVEGKVSGYKIVYKL